MFPLRSLLVLVLALACPAARAATLVVDSTDPAPSLPGACTLRAAVQAAAQDAAVGGCPAGDAGQDVIVLPANAVFTFSDSADPVLPYALFLTNPDLRIEGNGALIQRSSLLPACIPDAVHQPGELGLIHVRGQSVRLTLQDLELRNGCAAQGGALRFQFDPPHIPVQVTVERVRLRDNAAGDGGAVWWSGDGPTLPFARLTLREVHFERNTAAGFGGAMRVRGRAVEIERSTFERSQAAVGAAISLAAYQPLLSNLTFDHNRTVPDPMLAELPSIVSIEAVGDTTPGYLVYSTFADNDPAGGAVLQLQRGTLTSVRVHGNWFGPSDSGSACDLPALQAGEFGTNLAADASCASSVVVIDAEPLALAQRGGFVPTRVPPPDSPAIELVSECHSFASGGFGTDARGAPRPQDGDGSGPALCDAGAVEFVRNRPPVLNGPTLAATLVDTPLFLEGPQAITLDDPDALDLPLSLAIGAESGSITLAAAPGLQCSDARGAGDPFLACVGPLALLQQALHRVGYVPPPGFAGNDRIQITVNDFGNGGDDGLLLGDEMSLLVRIDALAPIVRLAPASLDFGPVPVGIQSALVVVLSNDGNADLGITSLAAFGDGGDFTLQHDCPAVLAAGAACSLDVGFAPSAAGERRGAILLQSDAPAGPSSLPLSGRGVDVSERVFRDGFEP